MRLFPKRVESGPDQGGRFVFWWWLDVPGPSGTYMTRLTLLRIPGLQVMLHWLRQPDHARDPHDHPWSFASIVLRGGYVEDRIELDHGERWEIGRKTRKIRWLNFCDSRTPHRIVWVEPRTLTLVITGGKRKSWGFYQRVSREVAGECQLQYVPWREYLGIER